MPSRDPTPQVLPPATEGIPPALVDMQRRTEAMFIALKTQEQSRIALQGRRPQPFVRPARSSVFLRVMMRFLPRLALYWQAGALRKSGLLDPVWYLETYPDVKTAGADPALHYLRSGAEEGRDPGPVFSTKHYKRLYPDVAAAGLNPLVHYLTAGWDEKRSIHPLMPEGQA